MLTGALGMTAAQAPSLLSVANKTLCFASLFPSACEYVYTRPEQTWAYFTDAIALLEAT